MHVTARLAKEEEDVEVGEDCRCLQALKEAIVVALPQLRVEWFDLSVDGCALDDDDSVVALQEGVCLDVVPNTRCLSALALREAGREVNEDGLLGAVISGDVALCTQFLDAGVPIDCATTWGEAPLHISCRRGHLEVVRLLLDRSCAIDKKDADSWTPLHYSCFNGHLEITTLLLDRGSCAIDAKEAEHDGTPLHVSCVNGHVETARLLLERGSRAIDERTCDGHTPLCVARRNGHFEVARLLEDAVSTAAPGAKRRRIGEQCVVL